jgi:hypothetical protein
LLGLPERESAQKPCTIDALKDNIQLEITYIENDVLQQAMHNMQCCVQMCLAEGSSHFQQLM